MDTTIRHALSRHQRGPCTIAGREGKSRGRGRGLTLTLQSKYDQKQACWDWFQKTTSCGDMTIALPFFLDPYSFAVTNGEVLQVGSYWNHGLFSFWCIPVAPLLSLAPSEDKEGMKKGIYPQSSFSFWTWLLIGFSSFIIGESIDRAYPQDFPQNGGLWQAKSKLDDSMSKAALAWR